MKRVALTLAAMTLTLAACEPQPAGEPVVTVELGDGDGGGDSGGDGGGDGAEIVPEPSLAGESEQAAEDAPRQASACSGAEFEGVPLTHCIADPAIHTIDTALAPRSGPDAALLLGWADTVDNSTIAFATNAGIYGDDLRALGYFVTGGERLRELDTDEGSGNFYLKPNGVFFGSGSEWRILTSDAFLKTVRDRPQFGTQSGPMLVIDGKLHPDIAENGASRAIRNGVGLDNEGRAHFVMAQEPLSFGQLARFFRDELDTPNALYLDGGAASNLWEPASARMDGGRVGPILVVSKKAAE